MKPASAAARPPHTGRRWAFALLAAFIWLVQPGAARSNDDDLKKEIADVEKQIADLQKKLDELKKAKSGPAVPGGVPESVVAQMNWRCIGPANMGGRITAVAVVESDPTTFYVATASGGLLKTVNNGTTFSFAFEKEATVSIGDVAVAPSDPNVVWVGTGEANPRNSVSYGDGVYKSTDGGKQWTNVGLKKSFSIAKIVIHPKNPNTVYIAVMGRVWGPSDERGVFKTTDGGKTWSKVLYVNDRTGAIDLRMDPFEPDTLHAAMWERQRDEFDGFFGTGGWPGLDQYGPAIAHGPGGGLFRTTDGGKSWNKLTGEKGASGLPTVKTGRIGLDYSRKTKGLVFAIIDTENTAQGRTLTVAMGVNLKSVQGGVELLTVADDGPAGKAGLQDGDLVTAIDGKKIANEDELLDVFELKKPGDVIKVTAVRSPKKKEEPKKEEPKKDGKKEEAKKEPAKKDDPKKDERQTLTVDVKLAERPTKQDAKAPPLALVPGTLAVTFETFEDAVKVAEVPKGGAAEKAGVKPGMTIIAVDGKDVNNWREFRSELRASPKATNPRKAGDKVKLTFKGVDMPPLTAELELGLAEVRVPVPPAPPGPPRPFIRDGQIGGQRENVQTKQGKDGFQTGGVYMSRDNGDTWTRVNSLNPRPFYFSQVRVDPTDDNRLYVLGIEPILQSTDGGKTFGGMQGTEIHADHHALWINPKNGKHMLVGCDGGFYITYDRGANWDHLNTHALGQFYHVAVDNRKPYRVYGGLQDNGSWGGPSRTLRDTGPTNADWQFLNGGDGFVCRVDPQDPDIVYFESQNGFVGWRNMKTGRRGFARPQPTKPGEELRFNWNTPYILSNHNPQIIYVGAQYVFRSVARGANLRAISPELTRTKQGSMTAIAESPKNADVLWAGTDDGFLWVTRDGGKTWTNVTDNLKAAGLPGYRWVATIEPSRTAEGKCYVCLDAHRSDDDRPYLFATDDFGKTWKAIMSNLPAFGSTRVLREDIVNPDILYCGTEFGIWVSLNAGKTWTKLNNNLPTVAVHEIAQPTTASEIVIATHGRSVWVLDVHSLRQLTSEALKAPATLFAPATVTRWQYEPPSFPYSREVRKFYGTNPPGGGVIDYLLTSPAKNASFKIYDVTGKEASAVAFRVDGKQVDKTGPLPATAGFHRVQIGIGRPGTYRVVLTVDGKDYTQLLTVENDPNAPAGAVLGGEATVPTDTDEHEQSGGRAPQVVPGVES